MIARLAWLEQNEIAAALVHAAHHPPQPDDMLGVLSDLMDMTRLTPAAVLIPLVQREDGWQVLFTERSAGLTHHGGEISFPGGRLDPEDADPIACALRETEEEVGIPRQRVEVLGGLTPYIVRSGYHVTPIVGIVPPRQSLVLEVGEVASAFEIPLTRLADPDLPQFRKRDLGDGRRVAIPHLPVEEGMIWGATAGMMLNLLTILTATSGTDRAAAE
ncbi:MAG: hypothetical protein Alpg2KO_11140 [Alphaproteobacteria bacterium]